VHFDDINIVDHKPTGLTHRLLFDKLKVLIHRDREKRFSMHIVSTLRHLQARREGGKGGSFPGPRDVWGAPPSLKNTENGVPGGFFLT